MQKLQGKRKKSAQPLRSATPWLFVLLVLSPGPALAGQESKDKILQQPAKYNRPTDDISLKPSKELIPLRPWIVWSDRDNNPTYISPRGGQQIQQTLAFMEELVVLDENKDYVKVAKDPNHDVLKLSGQARIRGWIPKTNLLLWRRCLVNKKNLSNRRVIILNREISDAESPLDVNLRAGPSAGHGFTRHKQRLFEFYYVYKEEKDALLIGRDIRIDAKHEGSNPIISGWIRKTQVMTWNNRLAIEPNWDRDAMREQEGGQIPACFLDKKNARKFIKGSSIDSSKVLWIHPPTGKRLPGVWRRFPVIETGSNKNNILKVGVMGEIGKRKKHPLAAKIEYLSDVVENRRFINIVFILEANMAMRKYLKSIASTQRLWTQRHNGLNIQVRSHVILYRMFPEDVAGITEVASLNSRTYNAIHRTYTRSELIAPDAMYRGIHRALNDTSLTNPNQTNILILIGTKGVDTRIGESEITLTDVIADFVRTPSHFLAIQTIDVYARQKYDFIDQSKSMAGGSPFKILFDIAGTTTHHKKIRSYKFPGNNRQLSSFYKHIIKPQKDKVLPVEALNQFIRAFIYRINFELRAPLEKAFTELNQLESELNTVSDSLKQVRRDFLTPFAPGIARALRKQGINQDTFKKLQARVYPYFIPAYVPLNVKSQKHPLFKFTLLFSLEELRKVCEKVEMLADAANAADPRNALITALRKTYETEGVISNRDFTKLRYEHVIDNAFGLHISNSVLHGLRLEDIRSEQTLPNFQLNNYFSELSNKARQLRRIFNQDVKEYSYAFRSNDIPYYWIAEDLLP